MTQSQQLSAEMRETFYKRFETNLFIIFLTYQAFHLQTLERYDATENFFELVRFDFLLDENLKLYLMEVNLSPNLTPMFKRFESNAVTNEQLIYNTLQLVGAGSYFDLMSG